MATIVSSELVSSEARGEYKRNRYKFVADNGDIHERVVLLPQATDDALRMAALAVLVLEEAAQAEFNNIIGAA